ncbi:MAG: hypothetical protein M3N02_07060, partial [Pseudomonadota bacterium]|nr:hypothetical protein [Pseudomonadota bacterium]
LSAIGPFEAHLAKLGFGSSVAFDQPASWAESYARFASGIAAFHDAVAPDELERHVAPFDISSMVADYEAAYRAVLGEVPA